MKIDSQSFFYGVVSCFFAMMLITGFVITEEFVAKETLLLNKIYINKRYYKLVPVE